MADGSTDRVPLRGSQLSIARNRHPGSSMAIRRADDHAAPKRFGQVVVLVQYMGDTFGDQRFMAREASRRQGQRHQPALRAFYQRPRERGKPAKVALVAAMRKLLAILNAVLKHHTPWSPLCRTTA